MDRRDLLKALSISPLTAGLFLTGIDTAEAKEQEQLLNESFQNDEKKYDFLNGRTPEEQQRDADLMKQKFFNDHEMKTITQLVDIIIPKDERSGSASEAGVPSFIEFIVKDMPNNQTPMRGGLNWLDMQCLKMFNKKFVDCTKEQQIQLIDKIAYPAKAEGNMKPGVAFFSLIRNLTASGYFSSEMGIKYLDYKGNTPNNWDGVPQEVLDKFGLAYDAIYSEK